MVDPETLKIQIRDAFSHVEYPGDHHLRGSDLGEEPYLLEAKFTGKTDWCVLDAEFIDQAPEGFGSALSFFSDEAFRFYLPAYLIADIDALLNQSTPVFHLCRGFDNESHHERINPRLYNERTWNDYARDRFGKFTSIEAAAIVGYLQFVRERDEFDRPMIDQALKTHWLERAT